MPERRSHTKSRSGCKQCKARRVKCDEKQSQCGACRKSLFGAVRQAFCVYDSSLAKNSSPTDDGRTIGAEGEPRELPYGAVSHHTHKAELELLYYWTTTTSATIGFNPQQLHDAQHEISQLALQHEFLLKTVFALTSLHLACLRPKAAQTLVDDAIRYQTSGISACRRSLDNLSASECRAQYQCSVLLGIIALALHSTDSGLTESLGAIDTLLSLSSLWRGAGSIMMVSQDILGKTMYQQIFPPLPMSEVDGVPILDAKTIGFLRRLEELADASESDREAYVETASGLRELFESSCTRGEIYHLLKWIPTVPQVFINHVSDCEPLACLVTMVYAVGLHEPELSDKRPYRNKEAYPWFMRGFSKYLVDELSQIVVSAKPEWLDIVEWATMRTNRHADGGVPA